MKQKDWTIIAAVGIVAAVFSIIISGIIFGSPTKNPIKVPVVNKISSNFPSPQNDDNYTKFFNNQALDPTTVIQIGNNNNNTPFQDGGNQ
jgi:hypothetical protein